MKILYALEAVNLKGGYDRIIIEKANYLSEHGCEVILTVASHALAEPFYHISGSVRLVDFGIDFHQQYKHSIIMRTFLYIWLMRRYRLALSSLIFSEHPDIVISSLGREIDFITDLNDGSAKVGESHIAKPYVRNLHLMEQRGFIYKLLAWYWKRKVEKAAGRLDALIVLTQHDAKSWEGIAKTVVIPNSLPFNPPVISKCESKNAIFVGRFNEQKGLEYLVESWEKVHQKSPDWILHIYGEGEQEQLLKRLIDKFGLHDVVMVHQPTAQIMDRYLESSIFVLTSRFEGFGMVIIEAMACGLPVVSFDCPWGPSELINNGYNGFLVEYLNTDEAADRICHLIESPTLRREMGENAKASVKKFERDKIMKLWMDLFEKLKT